MGLRSKAREISLKVLYQQEISKCSLDYALEDNLSQIDFPQEAADFVKYLVEGVNNKRDELDKFIAKYALNWDISRMAVVDKNILRLAVYELVYTDDIPPKVSINEAVELAKKYGDVDSTKFVNGILDSVYRKEISSKST